jgi:hypothetical protein
MLCFTSKPRLAATVLNMYSTYSLTVASSLTTIDINVTTIALQVCCGEKVGTLFCLDADAMEALDTVK